MYSACFVVLSPTLKVTVSQPWHVKEKTEQQLINSISDFKKYALKPPDTQEKVILPTKDDIKKEKSGAVLVSLN